MKIVRVSEPSTTLMFAFCFIRAMSCGAGSSTKSSSPDSSAAVRVDSDFTGV